ncbi:hypothetical protein CC86DRAFT_371259 [Ophiobolus disseminans]|uniref:Uncharacterized protein n=1 Tax=Ophiobolus disseminans TaxID=1469910 RepID=A0A6A6ZW47_9PLEO|nr:hypothetical protein CC86DRAFT_371259 [Ophiobolus disseminans]
MSNYLSEPEATALQAAHTTPIPPTFHLWSQLPTELKFEILSHVLPISISINATAHKDYVSNDLDDIIRTRNRELVSLSLDTYYSKNTFKMDCPLPWSRGVLPNITGPPPEQGKRIRHLMVLVYHCSFGENVSDSLDENRSGWKYLLRASDDVDDGARKWAWQRRYPNLGSLEIHLDVCDTAISAKGDTTCADCLFRRRRLDALETWLRKMDIALRAGKVKVLIAHEDAKDWRPCRCRCTVPIESLLQRRMTRME